MEKKVWSRPEMQIQEFVANEYISACNSKSWTEKGCVGNVPGDDYVRFNHDTKLMGEAQDNGFSYGEFAKVNEAGWSTHDCEEGSTNNPNRQVLYMLNSWWNQVTSMINTAKNDGTYSDNTLISNSLWGIGYHPGNSGHHVYDQVYYESHS
ncbi:MAG: hypothetical protein IJO02_10220 [Clostridia bacterium]|nr:hypothetical protein [Clostridia bacterium]MBQ4608677.1 hypothetical protein [Clostridia bacterium]MBQ6859773.1 hypothetical protein [Clostridia bacterium]